MLFPTLELTVPVGPTLEANVTGVLIPIEVEPERVMLDPEVEFTVTVLVKLPEPVLVPDTTTCCPTAKLVPVHENCPPVPVIATLDNVLVSDPDLEQLFPFSVTVPISASRRSIDKSLVLAEPLASALPVLAGVICRLPP